jgi:hypothetical protein
MTHGKVFRFMAAALAAALLAGCAEVWTRQPLPQARLTAAEQARFAGTWVLPLDYKAVPYTIAFDCDGAAHLAVLDWKDSHFTVEQSVVVIARGKHSDSDSGYISIPDQEQGQPTAYPFARYTFASSTDLVIWWPDPAPFAAAIKAGRLKGTTDEHQTEIAATPQQVLDFLDDPANPPLFAYDKPYLFRKVAEGGERPEACGKQ